MKPRVGRKGRRVTNRLSAHVSRVREDRDRTENTGDGREEMRILSELIALYYIRVMKDFLNNLFVLAKGERGEQRKRVYARVEPTEERVREKTRECEEDV